MLDRLTTGISDANPDLIDWVKAPQDIVDGVEVVFTAVKDRQADEANTINDLFDLLKRIAELAGEAFEWPIVAGAVAAFAPLAAIGAGYLDAAEEIKKKAATIAFAEGVAMGVMAEKVEFIRDQFWEQQLPLQRNASFEQGDVIEQYYKNGALILGYDYGRDLQANPIFFADLKRVDDQSLVTHGDPTAENWGPQEWRNFYIDLAGAFVRLHIRDSN